MTLEKQKIQTGWHQSILGGKGYFEMDCLWFLKLFFVDYEANCKRDNNDKPSAPNLPLLVKLYVSWL